MARNLATKYTFTGPRTIKVLDRDPFEVQNIRLLVNETQKVVICSSMQKNLVTSVVGTEITYVDTLPPLVEGDKITIEIDYGIECAEAIEVELRSGKKKVTDSIIENGGTSSPDKTLGEIAEDVNTIPSTALEKELQEGKTKIAREILKKGGASDDKHSLSELAYDVTTIPNPESVEVPSVGSEWENVCKAMWTSNIPYTYDIIAEYNRVKDIYINMDEPEAYHCAIICGYYDNESEYVILGNADAYVIGIGQENGQALTEIILDSELSNKNYFWKDKDMNNHIIIYLYKESFAGIADFTLAKTKNAPYCMYAKGCPFVKKFNCSDRITEGVYFDCEPLLDSVDTQVFFTSKSFIYNNTTKTNTQPTLKGAEVANFYSLIEENNASIYLMDVVINCSVNFPNLKINNSTLIRGVKSNVHTFTFPNLVTSNNYIYLIASSTIDKNIHNFIVPKLQEVTNTLIQVRGDNLPNFTEFDAPSLQTINGTLLSETNAVEKVSLPMLQNITGTIISGKNAKQIIVPQLTHIVVGRNGTGLISGSLELTDIDLSAVVSLKSQTTWILTMFPTCINLSSIKFGKLIEMDKPASLTQEKDWLTGLINLSNITVGNGTDITLYFGSWKPTNVLSNPQLLINIETNLVDNLADLSGTTAKTIYFSKEIRDLIRGKQAETKLMNKNWTISPA